MTPKLPALIDDDWGMTINFRSMRRPTTPPCDHESQIRTEIAGMSRSVCETCGRVSVGYVGNHFLYATTEDDVTESARS
jgi:hypothetical protein